MNSLRTILMGLILLGATCFCPGGQTFAQFAQLKIDPPEYDFGKVPRSRILKHMFLLSNIGSATLYIRSVAVT